MTEKPRVGQTLSTRVTFIREDGRINVSMRPAKEKAIDMDAQMILTYSKNATAKCRTATIRRLK